MTISSCLPTCKHSSIQLSYATTLAGVSEQHKNGSAGLLAHTNFLNTLTNLIPKSIAAFFRPCIGASNFKETFSGFFFSSPSEIFMQTSCSSSENSPFRNPPFTSSIPEHSCSTIIITNATLLVTSFVTGNDTLFSFQCAFRFALNLVSGTLIHSKNLFRSS